MAGKIKVTQTRSLSGQVQQHHRVMKALGLRRINHSVVHDNSPVIRGMVKKVMHLVKFEEMPS